MDGTLPPSTRFSPRFRSCSHNFGAPPRDALALQSTGLRHLPGDRHMSISIRRLAAFALVILAVPVAAQQEVPMRGTTPVAPQGIKIPPLPDAPVRYETAEGQNIRVSVYARGFRNPWSMAFVSADTILVAERGGAIRVVRNGVVDPQPVAGGPQAIGAGLSGTDLALHPDFERNRFVYISYTKQLEPAAPAAGRGAAPAAGQAAPAAAQGAVPAAAQGAVPAAAQGAVPAGQGAAPAAGRGAAPAAGRGGRGGGQPRTTVAVARAVWDGKRFNDVKDIFVGEGGSGGPIVFGGDGMLYVA